MDYIFPLSEYLTITQVFKSSHLGLDFGWTSGHSGQTIIAAEEGVVYERADGWGNTYKQGKKIYGNYVIIKHPNGDYTVYGHMATGVLVKKGEAVKKGQALGHMGNSGYSQGQHLHFEVRVSGYNKSKYAKDPLNYVAIENPNLIVSEKSLEKDRIQYRKTSWGTPVPRNSLVDQLYISATQLRARTEPSLSAKILGFASPGYYDVKEIRDAEGYKWYSIEDFWVANNGSWCEYLPKTVPHYDLTMHGLLTAQKEAMVSWCKSEGIAYDVKEV